MNEWLVTSEFEEQIKMAFNIPDVRPEFVEKLGRELQKKEKAENLSHRRLFGLRPAWAIIIMVFALVFLTTLIIGPQQVYAGFKKLLGYIPGVGLVEQETSIRMLQEPVRQTREGITVAVNQAFLLEDETRIDYGVSGVPLSAYPEREVVTGCIEPPYLQLPDGTQMDINAPVPDNIYEAVFVLPCIFNTLPDTTPTGWQLPLIFVDAPEDIEILPVQEVSPSPGESGFEVLPTYVETQDAAAAQAYISVDGVIEIEDGYILMGSVRSLTPEGSWLQIIGPMVIRDAAGDTIQYGFPEDIHPPMNIDIGRGGYNWAVQIDGAGLAFPITISFNAVVISGVEIDEPGRFVFDVGSEPQPGQVWELNQDIDIGGYVITLLAVSAMEDGYSFSIDPGTELVDVNISIEGVQALAGGGGGSWGDEFTRSMIFSELPAGELTLVFDNPVRAEPLESLQTEWQPEVIREFETKHPEGVCLDRSTYSSIPDHPAGLSGMVVVAQVEPQMQLIYSMLDGTGSRILAAGSVHGSVSMDGEMLVYGKEGGLGLVNIETGVEETIIGYSGISQHWSPDGNRIAFVSAGTAYGIFMIGREGGDPVQLSNLGYESIAGWSPDSTRLYYTIPGSSNEGFELWEVNVGSGEASFLFVIENSSLKAPYPAVSPDGSRIAYRGRDNSSLYIKNMDGSEARLLLDDPTLAVSGIAWEREGYLLGISLITGVNHEGEVILLSPESCETYRFRGVRGELRAIWIE